MNELRRRRELDEHRHLGSAIGRDEGWWLRLNDLVVLERSEREEHFVERFGKRLGEVAARFAGLDRLPPEIELEERISFVNSVAESMEGSNDPSGLHPALALIEATELRTDKNYIRPENRDGIPLQWMYVPPGIEVPKDEDWQ